MIGRVAVWQCGGKCARPLPTPKIPDLTAQHPEGRQGGGPRLPCFRFIACVNVPLPFETTVACTQALQ